MGYVAAAHAFISFVTAAIYYDASQCGYRPGPLAMAWLLCFNWITSMLFIITAISGT